jgi:hypothetical protein
VVGGLLLLLHQLLFLFADIRIDVVILVAACQDKQHVVSLKLCLQHLVLLLCAVVIDVFKNI